MTTLKAAYAHYDLTLATPWSWSAANDQKVGLTFWADQMKGPICDLIGSPNLDIWKNRQGNRQRIGHIRQALAKYDGVVSVILATAIDPSAEPRQVKDAIPYGTAVIEQFEPSGEFRAAMMHYETPTLDGPTPAIELAKFQHDTIVALALRHRRIRDAIDLLTELDAIIGRSRNDTPYDVVGRMLASREAARLLDMPADNTLSYARSLDLDAIKAFCGKNGVIVDFDSAPNPGVAKMRAMNAITAAMRTGKKLTR
jgi:hypothetical protein